MASTEEHELHFKHAVDNATRSMRRRATIGYLILMLGGAAMFFNGQLTSRNEREAIVRSGTVVAVEACNRDFETTQKVRDVFRRSLFSARKDYESGRLDLAGYLNSKEFYERELRNFELPDCRRAADTTTADDDETRDPPRPLHP